MLQAQLVACFCSSDYIIIPVVQYNIITSTNVL